ncbi:MAG TPA: transglycosylase domain-containing protein [Candidatus Limnocylindrales bacterium]|nr:transglycosylase domain-containing protein [Candidatus Limnocylindrales bacterium]
MRRRSPRRANFRAAQRWRRRSRSGLRRILLVAVLSVLMLPLLTLPAFAATTVGVLPSVDGLSTSELNQDMLIYDRNGTLLADIGDQGDHRIVVPLAYISPWLVKATIAVEDHSFYQNDGVDFLGTLRAALADTTHRGITQGGSTISQQLVKQVFIGPNPAPTIQRKVREALLALELNRHYSKHDILEMYLNTIYYGSQTYGVESAARSYFRTNAHDLTLAQASLLAGLPQAPTAYNPLLHLDRAKVRQKEVLQAMVTQRVITQKQADAAFAEKVDIYPPANRYQAPYFVDYVLQALSSQFHITPSQHKGYRITTSLDLNLQHLAEQVVHDQVAAKGAYYNFHDAALVSMDPKTGEIVAMVGGYDYNAPAGQINMANSPRQPGSSFKIFTYTAAIESRQVNMISPILDEPLTFPVFGGNDGYAPYAPQNYDGRYHGTLPLKVAMGNSLNIPALKTELRIGIPSVLSAARRMGVTHLTKPDDQYGMSLTLGASEVTPVDMVTGASTLATLGVRHMPAPVLAIRDGLGRPVFTYDPATNAYQAVSPQVAYIMGAIMSDDRNRCMEFGCHGDLTLPGRHVAAKTGTTQSFHDNWTVGYTPTLATAVWVGNPDNAALNHNSTGIVGAAPIWHTFMLRALAGVPDQWYPVPAGLHQVGGNYFLPGTENVRPILSQPWPGCPFARYNPYTLTYAQLLVGGVPCVLRRGSAPAPAPHS